jgi:hypothetical protein
MPWGAKAFGDRAEWVERLAGRPVSTLVNGIACYYLATGADGSGNASAHTPNQAQAIIP